MKSGIYKITNKVNGKLYVGSAIVLLERWSKHKYCLKMNNHHSIHLQNAWNKDGESNFIFEVIEEVKDKELLLEREQYWLDYYQSYKQEIGYNICKNAWSRIGLSSWIKGKHQTKETRKKMSESHKGKHLSVETKKKISESHKGKIVSEETRKKMSNSYKGFCGKCHTMEAKLKCSVKQRGEMGNNSKWNWKQIKDMRDKYENYNFTYQQIMDLYNISKSNLYFILKYKTWKEENGQ